MKLNSKRQAGAKADSSKKANDYSVSQHRSKPNVISRFLSTDKKATTIKATDLRVGNFIYDHKNKKKEVAYVGETIGLFNKIGGTQKYQYDPIFSGDINDLKPIPLTPKILKQYGFEYGVTGTGEDKVQFWDKKTPEHKHSFGSFYFSVVKWYEGEFTFSHQSIRSDCKYLHQLQNLWFSLTGQELQVVANGL